MTREKRSYIILALAVVVFVAVVVNQFVLSNDGLPDTAETDQPVTPIGHTVNPPSQFHGRKSEVTTSDAGLYPLPLEALNRKSNYASAVKRQPFRYYVPPPPPPEPPPPPPPLTIAAVEPSSVYAGTEAFTLHVSGQDLPEDAAISVNGRRLPTNYLNESELDASIDKSMIAIPGRLVVMVKNESGELFSNSLNVTIQVTPEPPFKFIGRIDNVVFLEKEDKSHLTTRLGETVGDRWLVAKIKGEDLVFEDTNLGLQHTVSMPEPQPSTPFSRATQRMPPRRTIQPSRRVVTQPTPRQNPRSNTRSDRPRN